MNLIRIPLFYISLTEKEIEQLLHSEIKILDLEVKPKLLEIYKLLDKYNSV